MGKVSKRTGKVEWNDAIRLDSKFGRTTERSVDGKSSGGHEGKSKWWWGKVHSNRPFIVCDGSTV